MENGGNMFSNGNRGHSSNNINLAWDIWELNNSRFDWGNTSNALYTSAAATAAAEAGGTTNSHPEASTAHALMFRHHNDSFHHQALYGAGDGSHLHPDPHLTCLKLGKRHYFEDATPLSDRHLGGFSIGKKSKSYYGQGGGGGGGVGPSSSPVLVGSTATVPRCQVEGCHVALVNAKDYHRRHKVCEMHSKAPKVVVLGQEQRFCQQCSRFHVVSEFDDSKRSCRRRLAGHNERRRKSSHDSLPRNSSQDNKLMTERFPYLASPTGRALSLLSSKADSWVSPSDLSSRSGAALRELIAENRAAILSRQLILDRDWHVHHHSMEDLGDAQPGSIVVPHQHQMLPDPHGWDRFQEASTHVTLDLMQAPSSAFGLLSLRGKTKEEECSDLWNSLEEGAHVV